MDEFDTIILENEIISFISQFIKKYLDIGYSFNEIYKLIYNSLKKIKKEHDDDDDKHKVDFLNEMILIIDMFGIIIYANNNAQKISGYSLEEMIGKNISMILDKEETYKLYQRLTLRNLGDKTDFFYKSKIISKNKLIILLEVGSTVINENNSKCILLTGIPIIS
jgi:PAS domain S-box-containing protein